MHSTTSKSYGQLRRLRTYDERFDYLSLEGQVGLATFGHARAVNQAFYQSYEWKRAREQVILRDNGCDLGVPGYEIHHDLLVHHIVPLTLDDFYEGSDLALKPDNLITTTLRTHNAIHYGNKSMLPSPAIERKPGDTKLW